METTQPPLDFYSPLKVGAWPDRIADIRAGKLPTPTMLTIHPEAFCHHDCSFCKYRNSQWAEHGDMQFLTAGWAEGETEGQTGKPKGKRVRGVSGWDKDLVNRLPKEMHEEGINAVEITGSGEPLVFGDIIPLFDNLAEYNIKIGLVSHGVLLTEEKRAHIKNLEWARFSIDAATQETYARVHGTRERDFAVAQKNIRMLITERPRTTVGISFIVTPYNLSEIQTAASYWKNEGARNIRFGFEHEPTGTANLTPEQHQLAQRNILAAQDETQDVTFRVFFQQDRFGNYSKPNTDFNSCGIQLFKPTIGYDANVYPCCIEMYQPKHVIGNLKENSLHDVLQGERRRAYVKAFDVKGCKPCWLRPTNKTIERLVATDETIDTTGLGHIEYV